MSNLAALATRHTGRALLLTPDAAMNLALQVRTVDARAFERPGRLSAFLRRVGLSGGREVAAWDDEEYRPAPLEERLVYTPRWMDEPEATGFCWSLKDGIALMSVDTPLVARGEEFCGTVYHGYDTLLKAMREAIADERVRGIFLHLNTPGGVVDGGLFALSAYMRQVREAAGGKPIWTYADQACSAGSWISCQSDRIYAPEVGYVGSTGAVIVHEDRSEALKQDGISVTAFTFGDEKVDGAWWQALTESARASFTADVTQCGNRFLDEVVAGRPSFTREALIATRARVYMARHEDDERSGEKVGFVDAIMSEEEAFAELVAHVSTAPKTIITPAPAATGSRAAPPSKEEPMATRASAKTKAALTAAQRKTKSLRAQLSAAEKEEDEAAKAVDDEEEDDDPDPAAVDPDDEDKDEPAAEGDDEDEDGESKDAKAIAASAEAKANPALAMAAISTGQTLAQFKASAAVAGKGGKTSRLDAAMAGSRRLGADVGKPSGKGGSDNPFSAAMAARAKSYRG
jgi:ClpP class serine protease